MVVDDQWEDNMTIYCDGYGGSVNCTGGNYAWANKYCYIGYDATVSGYGDPLNCDSIIAGYRMHTQAVYPSCYPPGDMYKHEWILLHAFQPGVFYQNQNQYPDCY